MFAGQMGSELVNWTLKRLIKEERPRRKSASVLITVYASAYGATRFMLWHMLIVVGMNGKGYGMPSSHAQFSVFFAVSLALFLLVRHDPHRPTTSTTHIPTKRWERILLSLLVGAVCSSVATSRIYLNYHTPRQVLVGCLAGAVLAFAWFGVTSWLRSSGWLEWILELSIVRWFRIRDLVVGEDLVDAGWERWRRSRTSKAMDPSYRKTK